jgi:hypothetical protein
MRLFERSFAPLLVIALAGLRPAYAHAASWWDDAWLDPALLEAHSLEGGSGFIHVPLPQSLPNGLLTGAIHRYRAKVGRGFPWGFEAGGQVELEGWKADEAEKRNLVYLRWAPIKADRFGVGVAVGAENIGMEDLGLKSLGFIPVDSLEPLDRYYAVAGGPLPKLDMFYWVAGYSGGRQRTSSAMAALAFAPFPGFATIAEYEEGFTNVGMRVLLSTQIKLDLSMSQLQTIDSSRPFAEVLDKNMRFGVSYSETWP